MDKIVLNGEEFNLVGNQPQENYSTTETKIGTWIDGKPLYRTTTFVGKIPELKTNSWAVLSPAPKNIDMLVSLTGRYNISNYQVYIPYYVENGSITLGLYNKTDIQIITNGNDPNKLISNISNLIYTIEYTKTTD